MPETPPVASFAIAADAAPTMAPSAGGARLADVARDVVRDRGAQVALTFLVLLTLSALLSPWIAPFDPALQGDLVKSSARPPSSTHWFGTDLLSRDVFSRMLHGARVSLGVAFLAATLASAVGLLYGGIAGYAGGALDSAMMRLVDACLAIPRILLLITVLALWGEVSVTSLVALLGLTGWFAVSRLARGQAMAIRTREFVVAAQALGVSHVQLLVRHVLPQALAPVLVAATIAVGQVIVLEAGLSYLGHGVPQPTPTWGNIIFDGRERIETTWWMTLFPGLALVSTALAVNTLADRLRAALNPRQLPAP